LVEQRIENPRVTGSIPVPGTIFSGSFGRTTRIVGWTSVCSIVLAIEGKNMRLLIGCLVGTTFAVAVSAQDGPDRVLALYCLGDDGCVAYLTPFTYPQMDALLDKMGTLEEEGRGKPVVFLRNNSGEWVDYVDDRRSLAEINAMFGGTGEPLTITTYPDLGDIQPTNGQWTVSIGAAAAQDCPPGLEDQVAGLNLFEAGSISFAAPFTPEQALPVAEAQWLKVAPNSYRAQLTLPGAEALRARYALTVDSADAMTGSLHVVAEIPGLPACTIVLPVAYAHEG
jgi:hypothetical protein